MLVLPVDGYEEEHMESDEGTMSDDNEILQHGDAFAGHLAEGLADNWSQVGFILVYHMTSIRL